MRKEILLPVFTYFLLGDVFRIHGIIDDSPSKALSLLESFYDHMTNEGQHSRFPQQHEYNYPNKLLQVNETVKRSGYRLGREQECSCKPSYRPFELGRQYYPRFVSVAHCDSYSCANRSHTCLQKIYMIKVLREQSPGQRNLPDSFLPKSLRADWLFEDVPVAVTCECIA